MTIERDLEAEEQRRDSIKTIQKQIIANKGLFDIYNERLDMLKKKRLQIMQSSNKNAPNPQKTIDQVVGNMNDISIMDTTIQDDKIKVKPKALADLGIQQAANSNRKQSM